MIAWGYAVALVQGEDGKPKQCRTSVTLGDASAPTHRFVYTQPEEDDEEDRPKFGKEWQEKFRDGELVAL